MQFVIVTGMSGAGKSTVLKFLEDIGFYCVDNLPPLLIPEFAKICEKGGKEFEKVALGLDIRGGSLFDDLLISLDRIKEFKFNILFLDASDEVLVNRYKETRRNHPLAKNDRVIVGISKERAFLANIKERSDYIIDTSFLLTRQLKEKINDIFVFDKQFDSLVITILSFGFKYGMPTDSDLVFDVRFIPNPYYIPALREKTGLQNDVKEFVLNWETSRVFLEKCTDMLQFLIPNYIKEGKNQLVIAIGCTGGKHRSVTLSCELFNALHLSGHSVIIDHRDISKI